MHENIVTLTIPNFITVGVILIVTFTFAGMVARWMKARQGMSA